MEFSLAITRNAQQIVLRDFSTNNHNKTRIMDLAELKEQKVSGLIFDEELKTDDFLAEFQNESRFYPIRSAQEFSINPDGFEKMNFEEAKIIFDKMRENWVLQNNLSLLEEFYKVVKHLQNLWPNDRTTFFEELWFILKSNLGASEIKLIFNDLQKATKDHEKNKLVRVKVEGSRVPNPVPASEEDELVMNHYEKEFINIFEITDYHKEKGQLVIAGSIRKSPVLIMAKVYGLSRMQKALLATLFEGLNQ